MYSPTKSLFNHQLPNHCHCLWIALSSQHQNILELEVVPPHPNLHVLEINTTGSQASDQPYPLQKAEERPPTGSISGNPLMCPPKKNGSLLEYGGGCFFCSENEVVLSVVP